MRIKKLLSVLFLSGVIFSSLLCAGCNGSSDPADNNERTEKEENNDAKEDNDVNDDSDAKEDNNEKEDSDAKEDNNEKEDSDAKEDNDVNEDNDAKEDNEVTVDDLVDAYLEVFYDAIDYTANESMELKTVYGEEYENIEACMVGDIIVTHDADTGITHQKGTVNFTYTLDGYDLDPETESYENYLVPSGNSTEIQFEKDPVSGEWIKTGEFASSKDQEAYLISTGDMSETQDSYLLTIDCPASDTGLDLTSLIGVAGDCDVKIVITVDKETMKCTSFSAEYNTDDINSLLSPEVMQIETLVVKLDNIKCENVELTLPEELQ